MVYHSINKITRLRALQFDYDQLQISMHTSKNFNNLKNQ